MADINQVITLGIGTPAGIQEFLTFGLQMGAATTVPDVVGETEAQATTDIQAVGLVISVQYAYSSTVATGLVISQDPAGGSSVAPGSTVTVTVSLGAQPAGVGSTGGGGAIYYPKRKRKERPIAELVDDVAAMYAELKADPKTKTEAAQIVKPYAEDKKAVPVRVDWQALEQDAARVSQLIALWQRREAQEREDEEWFMLH